MKFTQNKWTETANTSESKGIVHWELEISKMCKDIEKIQIENLWSNTMTN